ncbi:selenocysteine lyase/cysteine desulfurase [Chitinophaga niastensis]|uniref:Selenocysteine lyase/cysteine desulfurase n=1 Tax=Chitinophaga niastensis TaxID=536980 RepID=A0A2P8HDM8_CHINA|nr:aminotransferase class V-fold PLP-dependent enzyme [Chitinophaga niastensis]PSL44336.1 selenocysteine lyase/cysteine desulfurase [Chitinophaga niastensis]
MEHVFSDNEIDFFRNDTTGCAHVTHLNNAGAGLMPKPVTAAIINHLTLEAEIGGYEASNLRAPEIKAFYHAAAKMLNCKPTNIAFTANATDAFDRAISSILFKAGDVILTTNEDYISNQITYLVFEKRFGVKLVRAASHSSGGVDLADLERCLIQYKPKLVAVTHIPTNSGLIQPVAEIGTLCEKYKTIYLIDACQSAGQLPLDVQQLKCDFMSITSRKFLRGPRGAGFLYVSDKMLEEGYEPLFIDMRGADWVADNKYIPRKDATRFEDWEFAYALLLGTAAAIDYYLQIDAIKIEKQVKYLAGYLRTALQKIDGITICDKGPDLGGLVTFHLKGAAPEQIKKYLLEKKINVVTSYRNFAVLDFDEKQVDWAIRVSPHYYNTIMEADLLIQAVRELSK